MSLQVERDLEAFHRKHGHFGWRADLENFDRIADMHRAVLDAAVLDVDIKALPESMGVRKWYKIEYQGGVGMCAGEMRCGCQELAYFRGTNGDIVQLNRLYAYRTAQRRDGIRGDFGSTVSGNADEARENGTPREELWPYQGRYLDIPANLAESLKADALHYRIRSWKRLQSYKEVLGWLVNGVGGVGIGIPWTLNPGKDGVVSRYSAWGAGGHAIALLDWNKRYLDSAGWPAIDMFNSHGTSFGDNGIAHCMPSVVDTWCQTQTVVGFSDMVDIRPRRYDWRQPHFV